MERAIKEVANGAHTEKPEEARLIKCQVKEDNILRPSGDSAVYVG